jgi:phosphoribosylformylglycinamidine synthase subunit PurQ / glutaminase
MTTQEYRAKVAVVVFPGSNCDHDVIHSYGTVFGHEVIPVWHKEEDLRGADVVVLPGGFSYGDYLRTGALAKLSPIMQKVREFADAGGPVIGICNGFQILCEAGLLPGALLQNTGMRFLSQFVHMRVESAATPFTAKCEPGSVVTCPVAHFDGNYFADDDTIAELEREGRVVFRYCDAQGQVDPNNPEININGSRNAIAGIRNARGNVVGLMPHPERAVEQLVGFIGGETGRAVLRPVPSGSSQN